MNIMKIILGILISVCLIIHIWILIRSEENDEKKLKEMIILHILLYFLSGRDLILNLQNYNIYKFLTLISWILFFYIFYFLIYYDYRRINEPDLKVMTKKEIFQLFRKRASENNKIFLKNKPFVITFVIYLFLQIILLFFK